MNGYLIAEEGPLAGTTIVFEEGAGDNVWSLGRDPETSDVLLEDPMVSRRHAIVRLTPEGFIFENLSTVNPATQNGMVIADPVLLKEGDILQIGSTFFNFTEIPPEQDVLPPPIAQPEQPRAGGPSAEMASELHFGPHPETRWLLKVISGPNAGAEFAMHKGATYLIGKDPNICDIVFQDLSVSRQHARLSIDADENAFVEDLGSRNGVIVNGELIGEKTLLTSQDLIALGTTTFLVVDRLEARETILSPAVGMPAMPSKAQEARAARKEKEDWKEMSIPKRHLIVAGVLAGVLFVSVFAMISLFKSEPIVVKQVDESVRIEQAIAGFPGVQFTYNHPSGKLFLVGHVLTSVNHQELLFALKELSFVRSVEDNVIVDELVWQNMNAMLALNPQWVGVSMYAPEPGKFVLRGYIDTVENAVALNDYVNLNFNYLDRLQNQVVVEKNLQSEIASMLASKGLGGVSFDLVDGELVLAGKVAKDKDSAYLTLIDAFKKVPGIREVKNYAVVTTAESSLTDITSQFQVTGYSKRDEMDYYVVINGKILGKGDLLEGMLITAIKPKMVLLEKEGQMFRIDYNLQ
ncbi:MAG: type III secretion system inner membrane ring subunit SctD [Verrucomicrobia bacterium]|nr:type III secretion system inner membrane ring subunit SctD [Verrucomicrobiota bacterium]